MVRSLLGGLAAVVLWAITAGPAAAADYGYAAAGFHAGSWGSPRSWDYFPYGRFDYGLNYYRTAPTVRSYAAYYPQPVADPALGRLEDGSAHLVVRLPADAQLWIDGVRSRQWGTERLFVSPPLAPGREFVYELHARWTEDGKAIDRVHKVRVHANSWVEADLAPAP
jgi:uncharacterized protein (TIGR03000 family)